MDHWERSSYCGGGSCIEIRHIDDLIEMRDSKDPRNVLTFTAEEWAAFTKGLRAGDFDHDQQDA